MVRWICIQNLLVDLILAVDLIHYCSLVCDYLSADLISIIFTSLTYFTSCLIFYNLYRFGSQYLIELLSIFKVCESVLPQGFSLCQVLWVSSTGLYLPMLSFVGFFHRTLSPSAKFRGLLPQDFISQC